MPGLEDLRKKLGKTEEPPKTPVIVPTPRVPRSKNRHEKFIETYYDVLVKALYNARNTIRGKKEVIAQDKSKQYYRDFLKYEEIIKELRNLK